ncbi:hypothetical protein CANARDRAFT_226945 [[Candida] arabinofermentans NRRL YB-2248]|uniref:Rrp15p-domain-containing protein n=1 Tax=[Candida] arabinofermentans NRRL YB-2248 TaxID=983967 RepID=A0A1E4STK7_9ASCO|nr:hypothetical protein CANARDRAFT_226945 [[Candida] arabinofermentans NRRL YB-2248]
MNALLDSRLKAYDRKDPILSRSKRDLKSFDDEKLNQKAKKLILLEKKQKLIKDRKIDILPMGDNARLILENEKKLKKIAQKGVIKLFNVILTTQVETKNQLKNDKVGSGRMKELVNEVSKERFLDLIKEAGTK